MQLKWGAFSFVDILAFLSCPIFCQHLMASAVPCSQQLLRPSLTAAPLLFLNEPF